MKKADYGDKFDNHLLEQYKQYTDIADRITQRRDQANVFYFSLVSALFAFISYIFQKGTINANNAIILAVISALGALICSSWYLYVMSKKELKRVKYRVISEMEKCLPYPCYTREKQMIDEGRTNGKYTAVRAIEAYIPAILAMAYVVLLVYAVYNMMVL